MSFTHFVPGNVLGKNPEKTKVLLEGFPGTF